MPVTSSQFCGGGGATVVERDDLASAPEPSRHSTSATRAPRCVPLAGAARERDAVPLPREAVVAGAVRGVHAVGGRGIGDLVHARPRVPGAVDDLDHGILHRGRARRRPTPSMRRAGSNDDGIVGIDGVDPPVQRARRRAAHVDAPAAVGTPDERRSLERLGAERVALEHAHGRRSARRRATTRRRWRSHGPSRRDGAGGTRGGSTPSAATALGPPAQ